MRFNFVVGQSHNHRKSEHNRVRISKNTFVLKSIETSKWTAFIEKQTQMHGYTLKIVAVLNV